MNGITRDVLADFTLRVGYDLECPAAVARSLGVPLYRFLWSPKTPEKDREYAHRAMSRRRAERLLSRVSLDDLTQVIQVAQEKRADARWWAERRQQEQDAR